MPNGGEANMLIEPTLATWVRTLLKRPHGLQMQLLIHMLPTNGDLDLFHMLPTNGDLEKCHRLPTKGGEANMLIEPSLTTWVRTLLKRPHGLIMQLLIHLLPTNGDLDLFHMLPTNGDLEQCHKLPTNGGEANLLIE